MDTEFLHGMATVVQSGGPVAMLVAVYIAHRALKRAADAVEALEKIRDAILIIAPLSVKSADDLNWLRRRGEISEGMLTRQSLMAQAILTEVRKIKGNAI